MLIGKEGEYEYIQEQLESDGYSFLALDIQTSSGNPYLILEVGIALLLSSSERRYKHQNLHYCVRDTNVNFDPGESFSFGCSYWKSLRSINNILRTMLNEPGVILIGHDFHDKLELIRTYVRFPTDIPVYDTATIWEQVEGTSYVTLKKLVEELNIKDRRVAMNNAGNNAYYIMASFLKLTTDYDSDEIDDYE